MAYVSLYRRYRPQTFAEVIGQGHVTTTLAHAVAEDRLHHAYLFTGPRGTGKTSTARILAKSLNCEKGPTPDPCGTCPHCLAITAGSSVDVIEIDAASHGGVDDVRELRDRVAFAPASARMKVYIVDECHMLSTAGWNAFLKTVEEPPGHVVFVFATTEPHKVLETILSRTQRFDFKRVDASALAAHVEEVGGREGLAFEPGAIGLIVRAGDGSVRDTLSVLDQVVAFTGPSVTLLGVAEVLGAVPDELLIEAADLIAAGDVPGLCVLVQRLGDSGHDLRQFGREMVEHLRALFLLRTAPEAGLVEAAPERLARLTAQSSRLGEVELVRAIELLGEAQAQMRRGSTRLPLEIALIKAALPEASGDGAALAARIDRLERNAMPFAPAPAVSPAQAPAESGEATAEAAEPVAPTAEAAEPAADPAAAVADADLDAVRRAWPAVLEATKARKRTLHAFLTEGRPVSVDGGALTLEFRAGYDFHAENCTREESQQLLGEVFAEILGEPLRVRSVIGERPAAPAAAADDDDDVDGDQLAAVLEREAEEAAGGLPDEEQAHADAIDTLTRDLGARVLEDPTER